jgi:PII-like signaling protein
VSAGARKLTVYLGERQRAHGAFLADAIVDVYARHELRTSLVLRGAEGFGARHGYRTDRQLTLSEDLPLVAVGVDAAPRIEAALADVRALGPRGLVTVERARLAPSPLALPAELDGQVKLTVYLGRREQAGGMPAFEAVVALLRRQGVAGATVLLGVDGTVRGARERAAFLARNARVPLMVISVGEAERIAAALAELDRLLDAPLATLERVRVCKRDGERFAAPLHLPETDPSGLQMWQKLMVYASERSRHDGAPLSTELVRRLRASGAAGATSLRGIWGYHGDHRPHGDSFWQLRRRVPVLTVIVDTPENSRRWYEIVDELTAETGLVTSEIVPAYRASAPGLARGGLRLARPGS